MIDEITKLYLRDKKFYTLREVDEISHERATEHKQKRSWLRKLEHFLLNSQGTAVDLKSGLENEIKEFNSRNEDILERASFYCSSMIIAKKCHRIVSMKNINEYKDLYKKMELEYLETVKQFIEQQYSDNITDMLIDHVTDALMVLIEVGDINAEKKIKGLDDFRGLIDCYNDIHQKVNSLKRHLDKKVINECREKYENICCLGETDIVINLIERIRSEIQSVYQIHAIKVEQQIKQEKDKHHPVISNLLNFYNEYKDLSTSFTGFDFAIVLDKYEGDKTDLVKIIDIYHKRVEEKKAKIKIIKSINLALDGWFESEKELKAMQNLMSIMRAPYQELIEPIKDIHKLYDSLLDYSGKKKKATFKPLDDKMRFDQNISAKKQFVAWHEVGKKLEEIEGKLLSIEYDGDDIDKRQKQLAALEDSLAKKICDSYIREKGNLEEHIQIYELALKNTNSSNQKDDLSKEMNILSQSHSDFSFQWKRAKKDIEILRDNPNEISPQDLSGYIEDIKAYLDNFRNHQILIYPEIKQKYISVKQDFDIFLPEIKKMWDSMSWEGTLCLREPNTDSRIVIFSKPVVYIGRADKEEPYAQNNMVKIPWGRISANHCLIDFEKGFIEDRGSTNQTFINKKGQKDIDNISKVSLSIVKEFNLALDITFQVFQEKDHFKGFHCIGFSTKHDHTIISITKQELIDDLKKTWFIYLPENRDLFIRKYDGQPAYMNSDPQRNYRIKINDGKYYFSDMEKGIEDLLIVKSDNPSLTMNIER